MRLPKLAWLAALACAAVTVSATAQQPAPPAAPPVQPPPASDVPPPPPPATAPQPAAAPAASPADVAPADVPPPPPAYQNADAAAPGSEQTACTPSCRTGFVCLEGQCISACNPPCPAGQMCTAAGECTADPNVPASAQSAAAAAAPEEGSERHDGFMLRATIGLGGGQLTLDGDALLVASEAEFSGAGLLWSIDIGGSPVENLVVHGRLAQFLIGNPDTSFDGEELGTLDEFSVGAVLIGPAVSYYFMPVNLYVTAAIGLGVVVVANDTDEDAEAASDAGLGLNVDVGKEWWVNDQWGFGVAGRFFYANAQDEDVADAQYECIGGGVLFSATYQ